MELPLGGILVVALVLRLYALNEGLWLDEVLGLVWYVRKPLGEILTTFDSEAQHFAYSILAHISIGVFGESAWALRLPAALMGVASIWALYLVGRQVAGRREGLLSAALLTISYHHVWFSQNARGYTGVLFCALLATWLYLRGMSERRPHVWLWYATVVALGVYTHLTMAFVVVTHFFMYLVDLLRRRGEPQRAMPFIYGFLFSGLLTFTLYGFGLPQFVNSALAEPSLVAAWKNPLWTLRETLGGLSLGFLPSAVALIALAVLGTGAASYLRCRPAIVVLLVVPALLSAATALSLGHHLWPRSFFVVAGFGILVVVRGGLVIGETIGRLLRLADPLPLRLGTAAVCTAIGLSAVTVPLAYGPKQDFTGARELINRERQPGDGIVAVGLAHYPCRIFFAPDWEGAADQAELDRIRARSDRTWVIYTFPTHMEEHHRDILSLLRKDYELVQRFDGTLRGGEVYVYRSNEQPREAASRT
jgi:hypothetical protein